jgi:hypothetical protein
MGPTNTGGGMALTGTSGVEVTLGEHNDCCAEIDPTETMVDTGIQLSDPVANPDPMGLAWSNA